MQNRKAYLYVFNTMSDWEYGYLTAELNTGRYFKKGTASLRVITVSATKESVTTMGGLTVQPDLTLDECRLASGDLLILPGGNTWGEAENQPVLDRAHEALKLRWPLLLFAGRPRRWRIRGIWMVCRIQATTWIT